MSRRKLECEGFGKACEEAGGACIGCGRKGASGASLTWRQRKAVVAALTERNQEIERLKSKIRALEAELTEATHGWVCDGRARHVERLLDAAESRKKP